MIFSEFNAREATIRRLRYFVVNAWRSKRPELVFLLVSIPSILAFAIIIPPLQGWDESAHFMRAYQVSELNAFPEVFDGHRSGGMVPVDIINLHDRFLTDMVISAQSNLRLKSNPLTYGGFLKDFTPDEMRVQKTFESSSVYSPISYAPQAAGILIARIMHLPLLSYIYSGRIFNAALYILIAYLAIKFATKAKWIILAIALLPTSLTAAATLSPDALVNSFALLLVAIFIKGLFDDKQLPTKYLLLALLSATILALTKQTYFLFAFLMLLLPARKSFGSIKRYLLWNACIIGVSMLAMLSWNLAIREIAEYTYLAHKPDQYVRPDEQLKYITNNIFGYAAKVFWEFSDFLNRFYIQMVGFLTWKGIVMPYLALWAIYAGLAVSFVITYLEDSVSNSFGKIRYLAVKYLPILIAIAIIFLVYTALYMTFNVVGAKKIDGVQGRYFIPLIPLFAMTVLLRKGKIPKSIEKLKKLELKNILMSILVFQTVVAVIVVFATNYIPGVKFN